MHIIYTECLDLQKKIEYPELCKFNGKLCTSHVLIVRICRKIGYLELCKSNKKLDTQDVRIVCICRKAEYAKLRWNSVHYMYGMSGFIEKLNSADTLNAQNCVNLMRNCVH